MRRLLVALLALLALAAPAQAHDRLVASDPADGSSLAQPPGAVVLEFSANVLAISPALRLRHADGTEAELGEAIVDGTRVRWDVLDAETLPAGEWEVLWAVTSSDGHPVEGRLGFTVEGSWQPVAAEEPAPGPTVEPSPASSEQAPTPAVPSAVPGGDDRDAVVDTASNAEAWFFAGLGLTALAVVVALLVVARRR